MANEGQASLGEASHDVDRYPNFYDVLRAIRTQADLPDGPIERLEVTTLANGEATYRVWAARAEEPEGGLIQPGESTP